MRENRKGKNETESGGTNSSVWKKRSYSLPYCGKMGRVTLKKEGDFRARKDRRDLPKGKKEVNDFLIRTRRKRRKAPFPGEEM